MSLSTENKNVESKFEGHVNEVPKTGNGMSSLKSVLELPVFNYKYIPNINQEEDEVMDSDEEEFRKWMKGTLESFEESDEKYTHSIYSQKLNEEITNLFNNKQKRIDFIERQMNKLYIETKNEIGISEFRAKYWDFQYTHINVLFGKKDTLHKTIYTPNNYLDVCQSLSERQKYPGRRTYDKCGIILGRLRPYHYRWRYTNKELKEKCKMNGIKGYSKMKKVELHKALMGI